VAKSSELKECALGPRLAGTIGKGNDPLPFGCRLAWRHDPRSHLHDCRVNRPAGRYPGTSRTHAVQSHQLPDGSGDRPRKARQCCRLVSPRSRSMPKVLEDPLDADMVYLHARTPPVSGSAPLPQDGQAEFCVRAGDFDVANARGCPASQQAHFSAAHALGMTTVLVVPEGQREVFPRPGNWKGAMRPMSII
jgi:hypothetical protein